MCGPKFCSMKISQEIKDQSVKGKEEMSKNLKNLEVTYIIGHNQYLAGHILD